MGALGGVPELALAAGSGKGGTSSLDVKAVSVRLTIGVAREVRAACRHEGS